MELPISAWKTTIATQSSSAKCARLKIELERGLPTMEHEDGARADQVRDDDVARAREHQRKDQRDLVERHRVGVTPELDVDDGELGCRVPDDQQHPGHRQRQRDRRKLAYDNQVEGRGDRADDDGESEDPREHAGTAAAAGLDGPAIRRRDRSRRSRFHPSSSAGPGHN